jgi:hypothetical protein
MTDLCGSQVKRFAHRSRLPFHSSTWPAARRTVRHTIWRITTRRGRSIQTTVSARSQTSGRTAV